MLVALLLLQAPPQEGSAGSNPAAPPGASQAQTSHERSSIEGQVVSATGGEPLRNSTVILRGIGPRAGVEFIAKTNLRGEFKIEGIDAGPYSLTAERAGFVKEAFTEQLAWVSNGRLTLKPGEHQSGVLFRLWAESVVTGKVVDTAGEPVVGVGVYLVQNAYIRGKRRLVAAARSSTNDLGEYRIFGAAPGSYFLVASENRDENGSLQYEHADQRELSVPTYYPGTAATSGAKRLDLIAGKTFDAGKMILQQAPAVILRGTIDSQAVAAQLFRVAVIPNDVVAAFTTRSFPVRKSNSGFEVRVPPGSYAVVVSWNGDGYSGATEIPVETGNAAVQNIALKVQQPRDVAGSVKVEGSSDVSSLAGSAVRVSTSAVRGFVFGDKPVSAIRPDGTFSLRNMTGESCSIDVTGLPANYYVKSISYRNIDLQRQYFSYDGSSGSIDVVVSPNGGSFSGLVSTEAGYPASGALVVLVPVSTAQEELRNYPFGMADTSGRFTLRGVPPNRYVAYAFLGLKPLAYYDPDLLRAITKYGAAATITAGGSVNVDLTAVPRQDLPIMDR